MDSYLHEQTDRGQYIWPTGKGRDVRSVGAAGSRRENKIAQQKQADKREKKKNTKKKIENSEKMISPARTLHSRFCKYLLRLVSISY